MAFEVYEFDPCPCLVKQATVKNQEVAETLGRLYGEIMEAEPEAILAGPPRLYYLAWSKEETTIEAAIPVEPDLASRSPLGKTYPGCVALQWVHQGPYEGLDEAWMKLWNEFGKRGSKQSGPCWDCYVTDPAEVKNPADWVTELQIPMQLD